LGNSAQALRDGRNSRVTVHRSRREYAGCGQLPRSRILDPWALAKPQRRHRSRCMPRPDPEFSAVFEPNARQQGPRSRFEQTGGRANGVERCRRRQPSSRCAPSPPNAGPAAPDGGSGLGRPPADNTASIRAMFRQNEHRELAEWPDGRRLYACPRGLPDWFRMLCYSIGRKGLLHCMRI